MSLKDTMARLVRHPSLPTPSKDKMTRMEKVAGHLASSGGSMGRGALDRDESWEAVAKRIDFEDLAAARPRDIRRALSDIWENKEWTAEAAPLVAHSLNERRKTYDRELVLAYLRRFPLEHRAFPALNTAASAAAERHDWPWRERGKKFLLWNADEGPGTIGKALLDADQPATVLRDAGLDGDLAAGLFVEDALEEACEQVGGSRGAKAEMLGSKLAGLFETLKIGGSDAMLAYGLLAPWRDANPSEPHRKAIAKILLARIGDPRFARARWMTVQVDLEDKMPGCDVERLVATLRRWLTDATVKAFFRIIGRTTDRKDQWDAREAFWLEYLDMGAISDAWFAFGRRAEALAGAMAKEESVPFGRVVGGGEPSHSSLIMSIGDTRIAEWSHNGSCRFWPTESQQAPALYAKSYDGNDLRTTSGPKGFSFIGHQGSWERKFARAVYNRTGISHPVHGQGSDY